MYIKLNRFGRVGGLSLRKIEMLRPIRKVVRQTSIEDQERAPFNIENRKYEIIYRDENYN